MYSYFKTAILEYGNIQGKEVIYIENLIYKEIKKTFKPVNELNRNMSKFKNRVSSIYNFSRKIQTVRNNIKNNSLNKLFKDVEEFRNRINKFHNTFKILKKLNKMVLIRINTPTLNIPKPFYINSLKGYQGSINSPPASSSKKRAKILKFVCFLGVLLLNYFTSKNLKYLKVISDNFKKGTQNLKDACLCIKRTSIINLSFTFAISLVILIIFVFIYLTVSKIESIIEDTDIYITIPIYYNDNSSNTEQP